MPGLLGGLSDILYGTPPSGFSPGVYLANMQALQQQIETMYGSAAKSNVLGSPAFAQIQSLLAPSASGELSTPLLAQYGAGARTNALNASTAKAGAMSDAARRNLSGSSIEQQGIENASLGESLANSGLLASLYGLQNQNTGQLAGLLGQGSEFDIAQNNAMLNAHAAALAGLSNQNAGMAQLGMQQNYQSALAGYQNAGGLTNSLLSAGMLYAMMPGAGAAGGAAGGGGLASSPGLTLGGSGYGMPGFGGSSYFPGIAGMGAGGY